MELWFLWDGRILFSLQVDAAHSEWSSFIMEREHSHGGESLVSCLAALYLQYGPALSQMLHGDRTFTPDVFHQHCNIVMPSDSVGPGPQERQMGRQGCTDGASVGPEHSQEDGIRQDGSGSTSSQHRARHESC